MKQRLRPKSVSWWEPRWSYLPSWLRSSRDIFSAAAWLRIVAVSAIIALAIYLAVELWLRPAMPALQFNWFFAFLMGTAGIAVCLLFLFGFYAAIPPRVTVSSKNVAIQHGQVISVFKHADIKAVHHVFRSNGRHYLRIETVKSQRRIGLSPKVSLDALAEHFGEKVVVHDRRKGKSSCAV